ncbi:MAG: DNA gyrase subunit B [Candidatus Nealsonbacteria bacterium]|nr:DNA gyrase subunit B [Candidatus Nealsonbacteria bacterium]
MPKKKKKTKKKSKSKTEEGQKGRQSKKEYTAKDIYVLDGLDPVRKRPGMYIGSTGSQGLHHLIKECVGNSIDEALMGYCDEIEVALLPDNMVRVEDNGRGIPVDKHARTKKSALETVMTTLHAGAKFGGKVYASTGGLHGVGVSVVCALSTYMKAEVCREGKRYSQEYARGKVKGKMKKEGGCRKTGTVITFQPDSSIFKIVDFSRKQILKYLRQQAYLTKGVRIKFVDKRVDPKYTYNFYFEGGIVSYVRFLTRGRKRVHDNIFYCSDQEEGVLVETAMAYTDEFESYEESFANNVYTKEGGMHLTGFRRALTRTINDYAKKYDLVSGKSDNFSGSVTREGLTVVISVKIKDPQFEGQTKAKLGNAEARSAVEKVIGDHLTDFLERNPGDAKDIVGKFIIAQKARKAAKAAKDVILKKRSLDGLALPGKLADCSSRKPEKSEIYIVEGESAGGSSRQARDRHFQAILPLRGKILNVERARLDRMLSNKEIKSLIIALGTAVGDEFDIEGARYHKVIIMCDADSDGNHIKALLLTLFYRYFKPLIEEGYLYIAQPPLYKIKAGRKVKYVYTEAEKEKVVGKLKKKNKRFSVQRYKGLGEMNADELWETTMNPENRTLLRVEVEDAREADRIFDTLMGSEVSSRKKFIQTYAKKVKNLDI